MENSSAMLERIKEHFRESIEIKTQCLSVLAPELVRGVELLSRSLTSGGKVLACGNGGSAADAQHFAAELVGRFERERPELGAIALTTDSSILTAVGNDYDFNEIFAKQVRALGRAGDVLLAISTSGNSRNVIAAIHAAQSRGMLIIAMTGRDGGAMGKLLRAEDVHLCVPHPRTARIQEVHLLCLHSLCDGVDAQLYPPEA